jgi:tetratricopeptide (TPR) repeat protein
MDPSPPPAGPPSRRWCIPPPLLREPNETLEGVHVLDEVPGDLGLVLWESLRDVTLWAAAEPAARTGLFRDGAAPVRFERIRAARPETGLELALTTVAALVADPAAALPTLLSTVCAEVARWAEGRGCATTALSYAQAAALARPDDPETALEVGRVALRHGRLLRAESWLRRSVGLARRAGAWAPYTRAYLGLGELLRLRGRAEDARRHLLKSVRAARRFGVSDVRGEAWHLLFLLARDAGENAQAERLAGYAVRAYGRNHPALPRLLLDLARLWVGRAEYVRALPVLRRVAERQGDPGGVAGALALLARAAAGAGNRPVFEEAWARAWAIIRHLEDPELPPAALVDLSRAAAMLGDWERMEQAVRRSRTGEAGHEPVTAEPPS